MSMCLKNFVKIFQTAIFHFFRIWRSAKPRPTINIILQFLGLDLVNINVSVNFYQNIPTVYELWAFSQTVFLTNSIAGKRMNIGKPDQQFSIYCTFQDHIQPTLTGHFQFKVQNYGIAYRRILETAHQSIGLNANWSAIYSTITKVR